MEASKNGFWCCMPLGWVPCDICQKSPNSNLVPRGLSYPPYGARERETLENACHVAPEQNYF